MTEILDDLNYKEKRQKKVEKIIIRNSIVTAILFIGIYYLRGILPETIIDWKDARVMTIGVLIFSVVILVVRFTIDAIHKIEDTKNAITLALYGAVTIFCADVLFKLVLKYFILRIEGEYVFFLQGAFALGLFGFLYGYIRAAKIRGEKRTIPILLLIGFFILFGTLVRMKVI